MKVTCLTYLIFLIELPKIRFKRSKRVTFSETNKKNYNKVI